jgi:hypothetical protein
MERNNSFGSNSKDYFVWNNSTDLKRENSVHVPAKIKEDGDNLTFAPQSEK